MTDNNTNAGAAFHAALQDLLTAIASASALSASALDSSVHDLHQTLVNLSAANTAITKAASRLYNVPLAAPESAAQVNAPAAAPTPHHPAVPTSFSPTGLPHMDGPWIAGNLYGVVPMMPLQAVPDNQDKWFAITRGKYVGLTKNSAISINAVTGFAGALSEKFGLQSEALEHFNGALVCGAVAINPS
ncbi:hypothetical protein DFH07DRAFT_785538 [Mycena maculata]|uniref:Uncharacterized protein n=1 Tax=Mycena maculata TaxID=230809 RepID=A0AAD7HAC0_9AGAR|nr:hypothetical protein DFH07DRAFT_785538 [Mycena maculata]